MHFYKFVPPSSPTGIELFRFLGWVLWLSDFNDKDMLMSVDAQHTARILWKPLLNNSNSFSPICSSPRVVKLLSPKKYLPGVHRAEMWSVNEEKKKPVLSFAKQRPGYLKADSCLQHEAPRLYSHSAVLKYWWLHPTLEVESTQKHTHDLPGWQPLPTHTVLQCPS